MQKILITVDLSKIDKSRIEDYEYTNKEGETIKEKRYKMEVVELNSTKTLKEGDTWVMKKTHAVIEGQTKDERARKEQSKFLGDGLQFMNKQQSESQAQSEYDNYGQQTEIVDDVDPSLIPF